MNTYIKTKHIYTSFLKIKGSSEASKNRGKNLLQTKILTRHVHLFIVFSSCSQVPILQALLWSTERSSSSDHRRPSCRSLSGIQSPSPLSNQMHGHLSTTMLLWSLERVSAKVKYPILSYSFLWNYTWTPGKFPSEIGRLDFLKRSFNNRVCNILRQANSMIISQPRDKTIGIKRGRRPRGAVTRHIVGGTRQSGPARDQASLSQYATTIHTTPSSLRPCHSAEHNLLRQMKSSSILMLGWAYITYIGIVTKVSTFV